MTILIWGFYVLPLKWLGWIRPISRPRADVFCYRVDAHRSPDWYLRRWARWRGWSGPHVIILNVPQSVRLLKHELRHCDQWLAHGIFYPLAYALCLIEGYKDNDFEEAAEECETKDCG